MAFADRKPHLDYPCSWSYRVIGDDVDRMREAIHEALGATPHTIEPGNTSRTGRYRSLDVKAMVLDEAHRHAVFRALRASKDVRMVL